jgi:hypothetical protein
VERALKKHPRLARFDRADAPLQVAGIPAMRRLTSLGAADPLPIDDILILADGVPRSLPFHAVSVHFGHAGFGQVSFMPGLSPSTGVMIGDSWWINGRNRSLAALYAVDAVGTSKKLPDPPVGVAAILAGLGKPRKTAQFVAPDAATASSSPSGSDDGSVSPDQEAVARIATIVSKYRHGMQALIERSGLPHVLPPAAEARVSNRGASGPLKPALVAAFKPLGFDCRGGSGTFTLRRRTTANHVVELDLDVGTWSRSLTFMFHVRGPGFNATLIPPVSVHEAAPQYPIGDTANWERIVANVRAVVEELARTFVAEVEEAAGRAPDWFEP